MLIIPALGRLRQEDYEVEASLGLHSEILSQKTNKNSHNSIRKQHNF
jgi:hypothetical protein